MGKRKTHEEYTLEVERINPNIEVIGRYAGHSTKILHKNKICKHEFKSAPYCILQGVNCPVCSGHAIGQPPLYENSIWASSHRNFFSQYLSEEQMKTIMPYSNKKISVTCPYCGTIKEIAPHTLLAQGLGCICNDKRTFPNKFVYDVLSQLKIDFKPEYNPLWSNGLRYDIYLLEHNCIIENHGGQHYQECSLTDRTLKEEQENDRYKQKIAYNNGIKHYIILDCSQSTTNHIKHSIMSSDLPYLLGFTENDIDWDHATEYATKGSIKLVSDLYNSGMKVMEISNILHITDKYVYSLLRKAFNMGWSHNLGGNEKIQVYCIELDEVFKSVSQAANKTTACRRGIINILEGTGTYSGKTKNNEKMHWLTLESAIEQGYISS